MTKNIMIAGVGGQGTLLASKVLGALLTQAGLDVKVSEVHGMAQRGGSVVTYVRYGQKVYSPLVDLGEADVLVGFELLEAARWLPYLKKDGVLIANTQQILPMPVITGATAYPQDLPQQLARSCKTLLLADALSPAKEAGSSRAVNVVLLGVLSQVLDFSPTAWEAALAAAIKPSLLELNRKAFAAGCALGDRLYSKS